MKKDIRFVDWLGLTWKHGGMSARQHFISIVWALFVALMIASKDPMLGVPLLCGLGIAFWWALRYAWRRDCENPPWYFKEGDKA